MDDYRKVCFFCKGDIVNKKTMEHVIPNSFLRKMGIQEEIVFGERKTQYSRIKVPSHASCNNELGSDFENKVLSMLDDTENLFRELDKENIDGHQMIVYPCDSYTSMIATWLSKIFYGMFYDDFIKTKDADWKEVCRSIINGGDFDLVRKSYKLGLGFNLPSSLFVFQTKEDGFDFATIPDCNAIMMKINRLVFILCIADGLLTKSYMNREALDKYRVHLEKVEKEDPGFPIHKLAFSEVLALKSCIKKSPSFAVSGDQIINTSFTTMAQSSESLYKIDDVELDYWRKEYLNYFNIRLF